MNKRWVPASSAAYCAAKGACAAAMPAIAREATNKPSFVSVLFSKSECILVINGLINSTTFGGNGSTGFDGAAGTGAAGAPLAAPTVEAIGTSCFTVDVFLAEDFELLE